MKRRMTLNMQKTDFSVGIIAAMTVEAEGICSSMTETSEKEVSGIKFVVGRLHGINAVVAVCGVGKVFAAICAETMILEFSPDLIINTGVAGTLTDKLSIGDIAIADKLVQHDMDTSPLGDPVGMISGINLVYLPTSEKYSALLLEATKKLGTKNCLVGTIASGDKFISDTDEKKRIVSLFDACACEMEGAAIAQVCYVNNTPCCVMRAISDGSDENASLDFPTFVKESAERGSAVIKAFFRLL